MPVDLDIAIRPARPADRGTIAEIITDAFVDCPVARWLHPVAQAAPSSLRAYFVHLLTGPTNVRVAEIGGRIRAAAIWTTCTIDRFVIHDLVIPGYNANYDRGGLLYTALRTLHPAGLHDHLLAVAVHPDDQRHGIGTALLNDSPPHWAHRPRHAVLADHLDELGARANYRVTQPAAVHLSSGTDLSAYHRPAPTPPARPATTPPRRENHRRRNRSAPPVAAAATV